MGKRHVKECLHFLLDILFIGFLQPEGSITFKVQKTSANKFLTHRVLVSIKVNNASKVLAQCQYVVSAAKKKKKKVIAMLLGKFHVYFFLKVEEVSSGNEGMQVNGVIKSFH